ncbi:MAG: glycosyl hydrolase family 95 catalytic domain-containing protein [Eubacteriales bacterium]
MQSTLTMRYPTAWHGDMWREGAPCGNGIVGALVYGGIGAEMILLNHTDLWRGGKICDIPDVSSSLSEVRRLLDEERPDLANGVISSALRDAGYSADTASPFPVCDIRIDNHTNVSFSHYRRVIDMEKAEVRVSWQEGDTKFVRSTFVSREDGLCYTRITADGSRTINADVALSIHDSETMHSNMIENPEISVKDDTICFSADNTTVYQPAMGSYGAVMRVSQTGGVTESGKQNIHVFGAKEVLLVTAVFVGKERQTGLLDAEAQLAELKDYDTALTPHAAKQSELFHGVNLSLTEPVDGEDPSNEQLLLEAYDSEMSNVLTEKMYAYGRYLFLCSSDPKGKPTHLVGLWNGTYSSFWAIHMFNVNFEMIHWQALSGNLVPYMRMALDYVEGFMDDFRENAKKIYGCRGIYVDSVNTPESGKAACLADHIINWTAGAAWLSQHFYDYYRYTGDECYLCEHALPFMAETALFYEDFLTVGPDGKYQFYPCTSPENVPLSTMQKLGSWAQVAKNASLDIAACRELLLDLLEASELTGLYADKRETWEKMLSLLPDYKYNEDGSLKEWADDFYTDNNAHRHHSHMYGVFPFAYHRFMRLLDKGQ